MRKVCATRVLADFKANNFQVLVATDIAARGLDIDQLPHVVNFELPNMVEDYVHLIGRTGRAGATGDAVSLVCVDELQLLSGIQHLFKRELPEIEVGGFMPTPNIHPEPIANGRQHQQRRNAGSHKQKRRRPRHKAGNGNVGQAWQARRPLVRSHSVEEDRQTIRVEQRKNEATKPYVQGMLLHGQGRSKVPTLLISRREDVGGNR